MPEETPSALLTLAQVLHLLALAAVLRARGEALRAVPELAGDAVTLFAAAATLTRLARSAQGLPPAAKRETKSARH